MNENRPPSDQGQSGAGAERPKSRDHLVGTVLDGRFQIEEVLGSGGMSVVYKATQLRVNRHVAIKTLKMQLDEKDMYRERFQREIASLCALSHPNIVTVYDALIGPDDQPYVVMDYLRGKSLEALIEDEGPMTVERYARISIQICSALEHAHKKGIIHRDLKPGNVVLLDNEMDFVKVVDFGLAKIGDQNRRLTHSGELWGSPPYMSPEQCMGEALDLRSDLYSIGAVMYEMLTGFDPYRNATSVFEFIKCHTSVPPPAMTTTNALVRVPSKVEAVVLKALEKDPNKRYQSAKEMQDAIVEATAGSVDKEQGEILFHLANQASTQATPKSASGSQSDRIESPVAAAQAFNRALNPQISKMGQEISPSAIDNYSPQGQAAPAAPPAGAAASPVDRWRPPGSTAPAPGQSMPPQEVPGAFAETDASAYLLGRAPTLREPTSPTSSLASARDIAQGAAPSPQPGVGPGTPPGNLAGSLPGNLSSAPLPSRAGASPSGKPAGAPPARMSRPGVSDSGPRNTNSVILIFLLILAALAGLIYFVPGLTGRGGAPAKTEAPAVTTPSTPAEPAASSTQTSTGTGGVETSAPDQQSATRTGKEQPNPSDDTATPRHPKHQRPGQRGQGPGRLRPAATATQPSAPPAKPKQAAAHNNPTAAHSTSPGASSSKPDPWSRLENLRDGGK